MESCKSLRLRDFSRDFFFAGIVLVRKRRLWLFLHMAVLSMFDAAGCESELAYIITRPDFLFTYAIAAAVLTPAVKSKMKDKSIKFAQEITQFE